MFNGFGTWDCETFGSPETCFTREPYELQVFPNKKYRLRLINTAAHGVFTDATLKSVTDFVSSHDMELG
jgi:hypothetical protein